MTKKKYKASLERHGYTISGNLTYIDTPYGVWVQRIVEDLVGFGLVSVDNPCSDGKDEENVKIIEQYTNGNYCEMKPGTVVLDYALSSYWRVISNNGETVELQNIRGGSNGARMSVDDSTCNNTFCLLDAK